MLDGSLPCFFSTAKQKRTDFSVRFVSALPIFPVRLQTSIFGTGELNFRVRNGNGWTLTAKNTNYRKWLLPNTTIFTSPLSRAFLSQTKAQQSGFCLAKEEGAGGAQFSPFPAEPERRPLLLTW